MRAAGRTVHVVRERPVAFNFSHIAALRERAPHPGELVRLERRAGGRLRSSFVVSPLRLPPYTGDPAGVLPLVAERDLAGLRARFPQLQLVQEGPVRLNAMPGYSLAFRASQRPRVLGREVLMPRPGAGTRVGVRVLMLARPGGEVASVRDLGAHGDTKLAYRSLRFGT